MVVHSLHFPLQRLHGIGAHQAVATIPKDPKKRTIYEQWWRQRRDVSPLAAHRCRLPTRQPHHTQNQDPTPTRGEIPLREIRYRGVGER